MKILAISCSPNAQGNTATLLNRVLDGARQEGGDTELYSVCGKTIEPCSGCRTCWQTGQCVIQDDMQALHDKMIEADGVVFGTPIYFYSMNAQAKTLLDRSGPLNSPDRSLANKVGGVVVTAGSLALVDALKDFYFYFATRQMVPANYVAAYAGPEGDVMKLEKCVKAAKDLGRQMVKIAEMKFRYPKDIERSRFAYGTHTH
jgi:multimeric flavodoxin WrbA